MGGWVVWELTACQPEIQNFNSVMVTLIFGHNHAVWFWETQVASYRLTRNY